MLTARRLAPASCRLLHAARPLASAWPAPVPVASCWGVIRRPLLLPAPHALQSQRRFLRVGSKPKAQPTVAVQERVAEDAAPHQDALQQAQAQNVFTAAPGTTAATVLGGDVGLQRHLQRTALQTAAGLGVTTIAVAACLAGALPLLAGKMVLVPGLAALGCLIGTSMMQPTITRDELGHLKSENSPGRQILANSFFFLQGMALAPLISFFSPTVVLAAGFATMGVAAGMGAFALSKPQGALLSWGGPLFVGVIGLLVCSLGGMLIGGAAASAAFWVTTIGGLGIFSAFVAYDIQSSIQQYKDGNPDHLGHAINMYINLVNIFRSLLVLLGMMDD